MVAVSPRAAIKTLATKGNLVASDLTAVAARVATTQGSGRSELTVADDVTDLREIYFP